MSQTSTNSMDSAPSSIPPIDIDPRGDVILEAEGERFRVSTKVLSLASKRFARLFIEIRPAENIDRNADRDLPVIEVDEYAYMLETMCRILHHDVSSQTGIAPETTSTLLALAICAKNCRCVQACYFVLESYWRKLNDELSRRYFPVSHVEPKAGQIPFLQSSFLDLLIVSAVLGNSELFRIASGRLLLVVADREGFRKFEYNQGVYLLPPLTLDSLDLVKSKYRQNRIQELRHVSQTHTVNGAVVCFEGDLYGTGLNTNRLEKQLLDFTLAGQSSLYWLFSFLHEQLLYLNHRLTCFGDHLNEALLNSSKLDEGLCLDCLIINEKEYLANSRQCTYRNHGTYVHQDLDRRRDNDDSGSEENQRNSNEGDDSQTATSVEDTEGDHNHNNNNDSGIDEDNDEQMHE